MDYFLVATMVFASLVALREAFASGADDPNWDLRWRALDPGYRDWLAAMTTSPSWQTTLEDPEEVILAEGFARRERRRSACFDLVGVSIVIVALALTLAGLTAFSIVTLAIATYSVGRALAVMLRKRQIRRRLPERGDSESAPRREGPAPVWPGPPQSPAAGRAPAEISSD